MIRFSFLYFPRFLLFTRISTVCNRRAIISIISHSLVYTKSIDSTRRHDVIEKMPTWFVFSWYFSLSNRHCESGSIRGIFVGLGWSETCFVFIVKVIRISFLHDVTQCDSLRYCLKNPSIFPSSVHACIRIQFSMDWHRPIVESEMQK